MRARAWLIGLAAVFCMAAASDPNERLPDPAQEARARSLFREVRCVVCQNESIDDSQADLAHDLRQIVRGQIAAGRNDAEVRDFLVRRYGEFILLKPAFSASNLVLWVTPFLIVVLGGGLLVLRNRKQATTVEGLTPEEEMRLARLTGQDQERSDI